VEAGTGVGGLGATLGVALDASESCATWVLMRAICSAGNFWLCSIDCRSSSAFSLFCISPSNGF